MYNIDGIAYAGEKTPQITICGVRPLDGYKLWVRFNSGEAKIFDFTPLLNTPAFSSLKDKAFFNSVYIDYGMTVWNDGSIDIAPETLYREGIPAAVE